MMVAAAFFITVLPTPAADWRMCQPGERNGPQKQCLVDGDTIWIGGLDQSLRLRSFDTPEPTTDICGGQTEIELAGRASARLLQLLNENEWTVEVFGLDQTGARLEATIRIDGQDVGDILISEGLARRWPDGEEWWCD
jgi:endonuclease YncB( thermonuclease family)